MKSEAGTSSPPHPHEMVSGNRAPSLGAPTLPPGGSCGPESNCRTPGVNGDLPGVRHTRRAPGGRASSTHTGPLRLPSHGLQVSHAKTALPDITHPGMAPTCSPWGTLRLHGDVAVIPHFCRFPFGAGALKLTPRALSQYEPRLPSHGSEMALKSKSIPKQ